MAQDTWLNLTLDAGTSAPDKHKHGCTGGTAAAGDATFSYDHAKLTTLNAVDSVFATIRQRLLAAGFK